MKKMSDEMMETNVIACLRGVSKIYGSGETRIVALDNVSLDFKRGSFTAIMGPSGSGKSTLLYCLAALDWPTRGQIELAGIDISRLADRQLTRLRQAHLGFVFQAYNLIPTLTARENILLPLQLARKKIGTPAMKAYFNQLTKALEIRDRLRHLPGELSGGQQQRVAIARALITRPKIVIADEPSGNLDTKSSKSLLEFLQFAVDEYHQTVVMVTHDIQAASYAQNVIFLKDGIVVDTLQQPTVPTILKKLENLED